MRRWVLIASALGMLVQGCQPGPTSKLFSWVAGPSIEQSPTRRPDWAAPVPADGIVALREVTPGLYRGGQPTLEGMSQLRELGVKTVINLRWLHSDEQRLAGDGIRYERIPIKAWEPQPQHVERFIEVLADRDSWPIFIHCDTGADRAGLMIAAYRVVVQGWSKEQAIHEMLRGGYSFRERFVEEYSMYIRLLDVERLRQIWQTNSSDEPDQQQRLAGQ